MANKWCGRLKGTRESDLRKSLEWTNPRCGGGSQEAVTHPNGTARSSQDSVQKNSEDLSLKSGSELPQRHQRPIRKDYFYVQRSVLKSKPSCRFSPEVRPPNESHRLSADGSIHIVSSGLKICLPDSAEQSLLPGALKGCCSDEGIRHIGGDREISGDNISPHLLG